MKVNDLKEEKGSCEESAGMVALPAAGTSPLEQPCQNRASIGTYEQAHHSR